MAIKPAWSSSDALTETDLASGVPMAKLGMYEPPYLYPKITPENMAKLRKLVAEDRREEAVTLFGLRRPHGEDPVTHAERRLAPRLDLFRLGHREAKRAELKKGHGG